MLNRAIAYTHSTTFEIGTNEENRTVNAMPTVNSFPCHTNARNEDMDTSTGAQDQRSWNRTEFRRALIIHLISVARASDTRSIQRFSQAKNLTNLIFS